MIWKSSRTAANACAIFQIFWLTCQITTSFLQSPVSADFSHVGVNFLKKFPFRSRDGVALGFLRDNLFLIDYSIKIAATLKSNTYLIIIGCYSSYLLVNVIGIWLCLHRFMADNRKISITLLRFRRYKNFRCSSYSYYLCYLFLHLHLDFWFCMDFEMRN